MIEIWRVPSPREASALAAQDRNPTVRRNDTGIRIEISSLSGTWFIELSRDECERIAWLLDPQNPTVAKDETDVGPLEPTPADPIEETPPPNQEAQS